MRLFDRIKIQADYFHEKREGVFINRQGLPAIVGLATKPKTNIGRARREWKKLSPHERSLSLKNIDEYYDNLTDTKYCMQASTYLSDKAFLNEYDY